MVPGHLLSALIHLLMSTEAQLVLSLECERNDRSFQVNKTSFILTYYSKTHCIIHGSSSQSRVTYLFAYLIDWLLTLDDKYRAYML
jgi:hypothetical protein